MWYVITSCLVLIIIALCLKLKKANELIQWLVDICKENGLIATLEEVLSKGYIQSIFAPPLIYKSEDSIGSLPIIDRGEQVVLGHGVNKAVGNVLFQTRMRPTKDLVVPKGALVSTVCTPEHPSVYFVTSIQRTISVSRIKDYYNPTMKCWQVEVPIEALFPGLTGNVAPGTIAVMRNKIQGFDRIINMDAMCGGA